MIVIKNDVWCDFGGYCFGPTKEGNCLICNDHGEEFFKQLREAINMGLRNVVIVKSALEVEKFIFFRDDEIKKVPEFMEKHPPRKDVYYFLRIKSIDLEKREVEVERVVVKEVHYDLFGEKIKEVKYFG